MKDVAQYLLTNYYPKYKGKNTHIVPTEESLIKALDLHKDKVIVIHRKNEMMGVAVFLTLSDTSYAMIEDLDLSNVQILGNLLSEQGDNLHFIILAADGIPAILEGIKFAKKLKPKTISWWNPDMTQVHRINLN